jgi:type IV pilus assembly protein PilB
MMLYSAPTCAQILKVLAAAGRLPDNEITQLETQGISTVDYLAEKLDAGLVNEELLCTILAKGYSMRRVTLGVKDVDLKAMALLPRDLGVQHHAFVFKVEDKFAHIAVVDPLTMADAPTFRSHTHLNGEFFLISPSEYLQISQTLGASLVSAPAFGAVGKEDEFFKIKDVPQQSEGKKDATPSAAPVKLELVNEKVVVRSKRALRTKWPIYDGDLVVEFCDQILRQAIAGNCSDIHIESFRESARVRMRMDGALQIVDM